MQEQGGFMDKGQPFWSGTTQSIEGKGEPVLLSFGFLSNTSCRTSFVRNCSSTMVEARYMSGFRDFDPILAALCGMLNAPQYLMQLLRPIGTLAHLFLPCLIKRDKMWQNEIDRCCQRDFERERRRQPLGRVRERPECESAGVGERQNARAPEWESASLLASANHSLS